MSERPLRENATKFKMKKKQLKVTNPKQMECLVLALEQNEYMARVKGKNGAGKTMAKVFWSNLAEKLNNLGPPMRDGNGWLKVWNDQKYLVKQKVKRSNGTHTTGARRYKYVILSSLEETIAKILRLRDTVNPIESVDIKADMSEDSNTYMEEECPDNEEREEIEETQDDNFLLSELISTETIQTITNVCASVERKIEEQTVIQKSILEEQKQTNRMLRKILRHKEEKLSLMKMELLEKQKYEKRILELKINYHDQLDKDFLAD